MKFWSSQPQSETACAENDLMRKSPNIGRAPVSRPIHRIGRIVSRALIGGLHHQYVRIEFLAHAAPVLREKCDQGAACCRCNPIATRAGVRFFIPEETRMN
jgi:hypothetical protein